MQGTQNQKTALFRLPKPTIPESTAASSAVELADALGRDLWALVQECGTFAWMLRECAAPLNRPSENFGECTGELCDLIEEAGQFSQKLGGFAETFRAREKLPGGLAPPLGDLARTLDDFGASIRRRIQESEDRCRPGGIVAQEALP